ncbi:hypothetical protein [Sporisorium scitamineum]|uniref:Uncharacterized protein n=1 Tax=Sporisorium scitamineum TaxID=49012 RepID=A0A0F7RZ65_9BASI|nr:hypothetical protein [Sporisorium scitamineum]
MPLGYLGPAVPFEALEPEDRHAWFGQLRVIPWILAAVALGLSVESIALIILAKQQCLGASYPVSSTPEKGCLLMGHASNLGHQKTSQGFIIAIRQKGDTQRFFQVPQVHPPIC